MQTETPITDLALRLGVSAAQLRSTALRLQRLALVKVTPAGVLLTGTGRQKLARLEAARSTVLRRITSAFEGIDPAHLAIIKDCLDALLECSELVVEEHLGHRPKADRRAIAKSSSTPGSEPQT
jgi:hypothetical protein